MLLAINKSNQKHIKGMKQSKVLDQLPIYHANFNKSPRIMGCMADSYMYRASRTTPLNFVRSILRPSNQVIHFRLRANVVSLEQFW
jgi:hypothetical protein